MYLKVNDIEYEIPFDPMLITIDEYIQYQDAYGKQLDEKLKSILENEALSEEDRDEALDAQLDEEGLAWFSFWTKLDLTVCRGTPNVAPMLAHYRVLRKLFNDCEEEAEEHLKEVIKWRGHDWLIQDFKVNPATQMAFNEVITSKEVIRQTRKYSLGKWTAMRYLCAVFLRKVGEPFADAMVWEGGERLTLMGTLPVGYALRVGFFLQSCVSILKKSFSVFARNGTNSLSAELMAHYEEWGWINFLASIAETKVFDIANSTLDSIECAKLANAYKVLIFASEKRDYAQAWEKTYKVK